MAQDMRSDGTEPSAETTDSNRHGQPLTCPDCGETVALHYHPQDDFPAIYAGFVAHCSCTMGAQLDSEAADDLAPKWFAETVQETEERADEWMRQYLADARDASRWTKSDGDE